MDAYNQGWREGYEEGKEEGLLRGARAAIGASWMIVADKLRDQGMDLAEITRLTGLTEDEMPQRKAPVSGGLSSNAAGD